MNGNRPGLTLLETMVALVILALVVVSGLELLAGTRRLSADADGWARAVVYAEEGLDAALGAPSDQPLHLDSLPRGLEREIRVRPWGEAGLVRVDVVVRWSGGEFELSRLEAP